MKSGWKRMLVAGLALGTAYWTTGGVAAAETSAVVTAATSATTENVDAASAAAVSLAFDASQYTEEHMAYGDETIAYRAYRGIVYVAHPAARRRTRMARTSARRRRSSSITRPPCATCATTRTACRPATRKRSSRTARR